MTGYNGIGWKRLPRLSAGFRPLCALGCPSDLLEIATRHDDLETIAHDIDVTDRAMAGQ